MSRDGNQALFAFGAGLAGGLVAVAAARFGGARLGAAAARPRAAITRYGVAPRAANAVVHGDTVYLSGQVGVVDGDGTLKGDVRQQTRETLAKIDKILAECGTSKRHVLSTQIWVKSISDHFAPMNEVWNDWVAEFPDEKGVRACVESEMARPSILVEIQVVAALP